MSQTVLLKLLTRRRFDTAELERAWVLRVAVNCCKDLKKTAWAAAGTSGERREIARSCRS